MGSFASVLAYIGLYRSTPRRQPPRQFRLRCNFMTQDGFMLAEGEGAVLHSSRGRRFLRDVALIESVFIDQGSSMRNLQEITMPIVHTKLIASCGGKVAVLPVNVARLSALCNEDDRKPLVVYVPREVLVSVPSS